MILPAYQQIGGIHPETATITNVLANQGFVAPHTGRPFSEALLLGIAGGLGAGYILWEFKQHEAAILVMGFQNRWNYTVDFMQHLCDRLGVQATFHETGGQKTATRHLEDALQQGQAAIVWVDQANLPYFHLRPMYHGCFGHVVTVFGQEDGEVFIDDRSQKALQVDADQFAAARARIGSYKNRLLVLDSEGATVDVETAVRAGIADCVEHLGRSSQTFALPVYEKWAKLMTDDKNKKGWLKVFGEGKGLYSTLSSIHEGIRHFGTKGAGLRHLYADFLLEAQPLLNEAAASAAAARYREAAARWTAFADACLPDDIPVLGKTRHLLARKYDLFLQQGNDDHAELAAISARLQELEAELNSHLPMTRDEMGDLFATLQAHLRDIYEAEQAALAALAEVRYG